MKNVSIVASGRMISAAACLLLAGTSLAQQKVEQVQELRGSFNQPLGASKSRSMSRTVVKEQQGDDAYTLTMNDDQITVEHNGEKVPADRVRREGNKVSVLGKDGMVEHEFTVMEAMPNAGRAERNIRVQSAPLAGEQPAVMVGIMMSYDKDEEGLVVQRVLEGMPGAKGGLREEDVIVEIEGKAVKGNESLREALKGKKPGDALAIVVNRDGERKNLSIELVKYDQQALDAANGDEQDLVPPAIMGDAFSTPDAQAMHDRIRDSIQKSLDLVRKGGGGDAWRDEVASSLERALGEIGKQPRVTVRSFSGSGSSGGGGRTMIFRGMPDQVFEVPGSPMGGHSEQLDKLTDAIERLTKRLETLEKKLDEKK
jgi:sulfur carrier protein ThiS